MYYIILDWKWKWKWKLLNIILYNIILNSISLLILYNLLEKNWYWYYYYLHTEFLEFWVNFVTVFGLFGWFCCVCRDRIGFGRRRFGFEGFFRGFIWRGGLLLFGFIGRRGEVWRGWRRLLLFQINLYLVLGLFAGCSFGLRCIFAIFDSVFSGFLRWNWGIFEVFGGKMRIFRCFFGKNEWKLDCIRYRKSILCLGNSYFLIFRDFFRSIPEIFPFFLGFWRCILANSRYFTNKISNFRYFPVFLANFGNN